MKLKGGIFGPARPSTFVLGWWDVTYEGPGGTLRTVSAATKACALRQAREAVREAQRAAAAKVPA